MTKSEFIKSLQLIHYKTIKVSGGIDQIIDNKDNRLLFFIKDNVIESVRDNASSISFGLEDSKIRFLEDSIFLKNKYCKYYRNTYFSKI